MDEIFTMTLYTLCVVAYIRVDGALGFGVGVLGNNVVIGT